MPPAPARSIAFSCRLAFGVLAAATLASCSGDSKGGQERPPAQVGYIVAHVSDVPIGVSLSGRTVAFETSEVRPQVTGVIRKRYFTEGGYVRAGQPLFQIDPSLYQAAVNQAQANLASARASADAAVAKADRYKPLADMEAVAKQDYTDALASARVAKASVAQMAAALDTAKVNLRFTTVPAPISGRIGRSLFTVGALASASQSDPLALIQRTDPIYVDMQQSATEMVALRHKLAAGGVKPGSTQVHLMLDGGTSYALPGTVQFSEVTVDESTGTVTLRARFPNPDGMLLPGMFVTATFDQATDPNAILVPQTAVQRDFDGSAYVMVVGDGNKAARHTVTAVRTYGTNSVITAGLKQGEKVIVQGLNGLKQGAAIKPVEASSPQPVGPPKAAAGASASKGS
ncbi:efflux RND transporter periplasmic adaptor subunit [Novosphingobium naphthalenivorans]|uniref:efflux RND transporter periplasmic adaptor subunit n=1 Tax=Novosphingobium naphthalenivorans TaxID=273168 RepID=UPI000836D8DC|nr:efflux RND transporter periplasmic adaptor subunit [Novosphingobium naphthalenivorans]